LNDVKPVIITQGKRIVITIRDAIVKIFTDADVAESGSVAEYGFKDWWGKVKEAASKFGKDVKAIVMKQIEQMKPQILEQLKQMKTVVIAGTKKVVIQIVNDVVQIIIGDEVGESTKVEEVGYGFRDIWAKVKAAAEKLKGEAKEKVKAAIEKYKPKILDGLKNINDDLLDIFKSI
jgi:hypothetical protein